MYDDYIGGQPSDATRTAPTAPATQNLHTPNASTTTAESAPDTNKFIYRGSSFPNTSQDVDELQQQQQHFQQQNNQPQLQSESSCFIDADHLSHVYKLKKAIYGLKQEPSAWLIQPRSTSRRSRGMSGHLQEYFRRNSILRRKASEMILEETRLFSAINRGGRRCVFIRLLCSSPLDENTVNRLWLLL
ncbi:hypothetical protein Tco_0332847 [Tanacetum coccineum]